MTVDSLSTWRRAHARLVGIALQAAGWLVPAPPPAEVQPALTAFRYQSIRRQVPALHLVAMVNVAIVMLVLWRQAAPIASYGWMPILWAYNLHRIYVWSRRTRDGVVPADAGRFLRQSILAGCGSMAPISLFSAWSFHVRLFNDPVLIPVSLAFGSFAIAHCLAALRPAAVAVIALGIFPSAAVMVVSGDFLATCIALSSTSVALLLLRFLAEHERHILATLALQQEVEQLASRDALTGLLNRRAFLIGWAAAQADAAPGRRALLVLDIDHFKAINDRFGHDVGDRVIFQFAALLAAAAQGRAIVGRFGGEEFVLLANIDDAADAQALAQRLADRVAAHDFRSPGCPVERVTASIGVHVVDADEIGFETAFAHADAALYAAKASGRNCVRLSEPAPGRRSAA